MRELDRAELAALLAPEFPRQAWYSQRVVAQSVLWAEAPASGTASFLTLADHRPMASPALFSALNRNKRSLTLDLKARPQVN